MKKEVTLISKKRQGSKELAGGEAPRRAWQGKAALGPACHIFEFRAIGPKVRVYIDPLFTLQLSETC